MTTTMDLDLDTAKRNQGFDAIPAGTQVELVMKIRPGNIGIEGLLKRTSKGDSRGARRRIHGQGRRVRRAQALRLHDARRHDGRPRQGRRDHPLAAAGDLRGGPRHRSERQRRRRRWHAGPALRSPDSTARHSSPRSRSSTAASDRTAASTATRT